MVSDIYVPRPMSTSVRHRANGVYTESLAQHRSIDPFSTQYWDPEPRKQPKKIANLSTQGQKMAPPPMPTDAFAALSGGLSSSPAEKLVKNEIMNAVKQAILDNKGLSKVGIVDVVFTKFRNDASRAEVKNTIEHVAERKGPGRQKEWELRMGHELAA